VRKTVTQSRKAGKEDVNPGIDRVFWAFIWKESWRPWRLGVSGQKEARRFLPLSLSSCRIL
jgi:hypothetical protein